MSITRPFVILLLVLLFARVQAGTVPGSAIASAHPLATRAGLEILDQGGNAFDAAIAVAATLAVVEPQGSGLGGGGFWLLHRAADGLDIMLDGRERAPQAARRDRYQTPAQSIDGALAAAIPGLPAALVHLAEHYGKLPLAASLAPAIHQARTGFAVGERYVRALETRLAALDASPAARAIFHADNHLALPGERLVQADLAHTLEHLARHGRPGFYAGEVAEKLVTGVRAGGGDWTRHDLESYRVVERQPLRGHYRGLRITTAAPPSAGGVGLIGMLNILSGYDLDGVSANTRRHLIIEAMRRAYHDREHYLGDPDFVSIPLLRLLSPNYAAGLRSTLRPDKATPSVFFSQTRPPEPDGANTSHYAILDSDGNRVAATLSINYGFGSGFVAPGTGVLLNDEMDDFATRPGMANVYGLVGGEPNAIAPGKRMLSSMTPTFVESNDAVALLGTPGGSRIVSMVLLAILDFAAGHGPASWVSLPRFHHQYLPDVVEYEPDSLSGPDIEDLQQRGHTLKPTSKPYGDFHAILWNHTTATLEAASDPRGEGQARVRLSKQ
jgi:gamma-glutamyltranspeptidase/glutathione hydrolase